MSIDIINKSNLEFEEDSIIYIECDDCGTICEDEEFFDEEICPECGGMLLITTSHEGCECAKCGTTLDCWQSAYRDVVEGFLICEHCYNKLDQVS